MIVHARKKRSPETDSDHRFKYLGQSESVCVRLERHRNSDAQPANARFKIKKECSKRVPSKNASVDREHRDSPEHSSSQPRKCKHQRTCDFCVSRFSHDFRENIPLPGIRLRPLRTPSTLRSGSNPISESNQKLRTHEAADKFPRISKSEDSLRHWDVTGQQKRWHHQQRDSDCQRGRLRCKENQRRVEHGQRKQHRLDGRLNSCGFRIRDCA